MASRRKAPRALATSGVANPAAAIRQAIERLYREYGPQGWWPVMTERGDFARKTGEREAQGYHPGQFDFPRSKQGRFEIGCGAVLTQNTAWTNVQRALAALTEARTLSPKRLLATPIEELGQWIRPAGYFNQKSVYLRAMAEWFEASDRRLSTAAPSEAVVERERPLLLEVRGIGPETADCILLYAYGQPTFVVDAYTRRVFGRLGLTSAADSYEAIRARFSEALRQADPRATVEGYQEAHALIVEHAKRHHGRHSEPASDFLLF